MAKTKKTGPGNKKSMARGQPQSAAEAFLKNGSRNASKALKKNTHPKPAPRQPPRMEMRSHNTRAKIPYRRGRADPTLVVKEAVAQSKHQTYYEIVDNTEKKKKLEFTIFNSREPPPGFTFVPVGNPELTQKCKDLSRMQDCMIFVVSMSTGASSDLMSEQMHRVGYHFRSTIVDEASTSVEVQSVRRGGVNTLQVSQPRHNPTGEVIDPLPATQKEIDEQADAAIRDLFPRIPHTDRRQIIDHAFQLGKVFAGKPVVGVQEDVPLPRRVQLAVLAHIRHTHTRYDKLLRETDWATARATIEVACLETLVKWRGDEETGRDQMDEVLREVVVISDDEDSESEETANDEDAEMEEGEVAEGRPDVQMEEAQPQPVSSHQPPNLDESNRREIISLLSPPHPRVAGTGIDAARMHGQDRRMESRRDRKAQRNERKGFKRYQAWNEALSRQQNGPEGSDKRPQTNFRQGEVHRNELYDHNSSGFASYHGEAQRNAPGPALSLQTPRTATFHGGEFIDLTESPYREKVTSGSLVDGPSRFKPHEQRDIGTERREFSQLGQHSSLVRDRAPLRLKPLSPPKSTLQDYLLPSIEQAPDRAVGDRQNLPALPRKSEVPKSRATETSALGFPLMADGTYRDAYGVIRNEDDRRIIYIDEHNREVNHGVGSSRRFASNFGEGSSATGTLSHGPTSASSATYRHDTVAVDSRSHLHLSAMHDHGQTNFESYSGNLEARPGGLRESGGAGYYSNMRLQPDIDHAGRQNPLFSMSSTQSIVSRESEVLRPRFQDVPADHNRVTGESSRVVRPISLSRFSDKNHGIARAEQFSHSSSHLHESVVYGQSDFEEPVLLSQTENGAVKYFREPTYAPRTQYEEPLPSRRPASTVQYGASRQPMIEYIDVDRPTSGHERIMQDRYAGRHADGRSEIIPMDHVRIPQYEGPPPLYGSRANPLRREVAGQDYLY